MTYYIKRTKGAGSHEDPERIEYLTVKGWASWEVLNHYNLCVKEYRRYKNAEKAAHKIRQSGTSWTIMVDTSPTIADTCGSI